MVGAWSGRGRRWHPGRGRVVFPTGTCDAVGVAQVVVEILTEQAGQNNHKAVIGLHDGTQVEAVVYREDSLCVSSQVGCAVACPFCASGARGFGRNLELSELVGQVEVMRDRHPNIQRVTLSGVGEPLHNHAHTLPFADWCRDQGLGISLTTSGGPIGRLRTWLEYPHKGLTLSIHSGTEPVRAKVVPHGPSLEHLFAELNSTVPRLSGSRRRKMALAYLLIAGLNDEDAEIDAFIARVEPLGLKLHLYSYNPVPTSTLQGVPSPRYLELAERIKARGLQVRMSAKARTADNGGCGTLVALHRRKQPNPTHRALTSD